MKTTLTTNAQTGEIVLSNCGATCTILGKSYRYEHDGVQYVSDWTALNNNPDGLPSFADAPCGAVAALRTLANVRAILKSLVWVGNDGSTPPVIAPEPLPEDPDGGDCYGDDDDDEDDDED